MKNKENITYGKGLLERTKANNEGDMD